MRGLLRIGISGPIIVRHRLDGDQMGRTIVRAEIMSQATGRQGIQAATDPAGILEAIGPEETLPAGTQAGTAQVGILEAIGPKETLEGILRVATGPGQVVGRAVRQAGHLWVVRRAGNDRNRLRVRDRVGLEAIAMAQPRRLRAIVAEPVRVAATREVEANEPSQS